MSTVDKICEEFGVRDGTNRARLVRALAANFGKPVPIEKLVKATYGARAPVSSKSKLAMVIGGAHLMIQKNRLPYRIIKERTEDGTTVALAKKARK
jgi:hypothetical protein